MCLLPCFEQYQNLRELRMKGNIYQQILLRDILFSVDNLFVRNFVFYIFTTVPVLTLHKKLLNS